MRLKELPVRPGLEKRRGEKIKHTHTHTKQCQLAWTEAERTDKLKRLNIVVYFGPIQGKNPGGVKEGVKTRKESWTVLVIDRIWGMKAKVRQSNNSEVFYPA